MTKTIRVNLVEEVVEYQCTQCEVVHKGTETQIPTCIMCSTSSRMIKLEQEKVYRVIINFGHNYSECFYVNEEVRRKIKVTFNSGGKMTIGFFDEDLDVNMDFVQIIRYTQLSKQEVNSFSEKLKQELSKYGAAHFKFNN